MTTINDFLSWCSQFWQNLSQQWWPILERQFALLLSTLMASVPLTMGLSFAALICSCLILRSLTLGGWGWARAVLMILLVLGGMLGVIFVAHQI
jgi:hypothetical protein